MAIITTLCGVRFRRKSQPRSSKSPPNQSSEKLGMITTSPPTLPTTRRTTEKTLNPTQQEAETKENVVKQAKDLLLPLPPLKQMKEPDSINNSQLSKSASTRSLITTVSMKLPRSLSMARIRNEEERINQKKKGKLRPEDSVWMKTIILGEKCKVPDEDEVVVYDGKGNRISTYHPKTPSSLPVSRQNSHIDINAVPGKDGRDFS